MKMCNCTLPSTQGLGTCKDCPNNKDNFTINFPKPLWSKEETNDMLKELANLRGKDLDDEDVE